MRNTGSYTIVKPYRCCHTVVYSLANLHINCECMGYSSFLAPKVTLGSIWLVSSYQWMSSYKPVIIMIAVLVVYGVYTRGFSLDRPLNSANTGIV